MCAQDLKRTLEPAIFYQDVGFITHNQPYVPLFQRSPAPIRLWAPSLSRGDTLHSSSSILSSFKFYSSPLSTDPLRRRVPFALGQITVEDVVELLARTKELFTKANIFDAVVAQV
jgi:hypothetical protein